MLLKSKIGYLFGIYNVYRMIRRGITQAYQGIKELDSAMNAIAVVTSMTTDQLWGTNKHLHGGCETIWSCNKGCF